MYLYDKQYKLNMFKCLYVQYQNSQKKTQLDPTKLNILSYLLHSNQLLGHVIDSAKIGDFWKCDKPFK